MNKTKKTSNASADRVFYSARIILLITVKPIQKHIQLVRSLKKTESTKKKIQNK